MLVALPHTGSSTHALGSALAGCSSACPAVLCKRPAGCPPEFSPIRLLGRYWDRVSTRYCAAHPTSQGLADKALR